MADDQQQPMPQTEFEIQIPPEIEPGMYANFLSVWHTPYEFTLDFAATQPSRQDEDGVHVPCRVVARLRIPPAVLLDVLAALNENVSRYQGSFGEIQRPTPPEGGETRAYEQPQDRPGAGGYH